MNERILGIQEINERTKNPKEFIRECEERYDNLVFDIADKLLNHMKESPVVLLTGPSSSGKTTTAQRIKDRLSSVKVHTISLDDYYLTHGENIPRDEFGKEDYESPYCLDLPLLNEQIMGIINRETVYIPKFDFETRSRTKSVTPLKLLDDEMVIFEGIHALNGEIAGKLDKKAVKIYIAPKTSVLCEDGKMIPPEILRLARRMVRDRNFRGASFERTLDMWYSVRRGERLYIDPFVKTAQFTADTYLGYESAIFMNILKEHKDEILPIIKEKGLDDLMYALHKFESIDYSEYMPQNSLLREFIG